MAVRCLAAGVLSLLLLVGSAGTASGDPVSGGTARLELNRELTVSLRDSGVRLTALGAARLHGRHLVLPVTGGQLISGLGRATVTGGMRFTSAAGIASLSGLVLDSRHGALIGKLGGAHLRLAVARRPRVRRDGFGYTVTLGKLVLTSNAARRLERRLGLRLPGIAHTLGILNAGVRRSRVTVTHGTAYLGLDEGFAANLRGLVVGGEPLGAGWTFSPAPLTIALTKLHGILALDLTSGQIESADGLRLFQGEVRGGEIEPVAGAAEVTLQAVSVDIAAKTLTAELRTQPSGVVETTAVASAQIPVFHKNAFTGEISFSANPLTLSAYMADLLNQAFTEPRSLPPAFAPGDPFAQISVSARTTGKPH